MDRKPDLKAALAAVTEVPAARLSLGELIDSWFTTNIDQQNPRLAKWREPFADISAWDVTSEQIVVCANALIDAGYKPSTVNRDISALGSAYKWAKRNRLTPRGFVSPTLGVERFTETPRRIELSKADLQRVLLRARGFRDARFGAFIALIVDSGARRNEVLERHWRDVDLDAGTIHCPTTKTGVPRVLHFRPETAKLLRRVWRSRNPDDLLFEGKVKGTVITYKTSWDKLTRELGLEWLHLHDLRHVAAADLLRSGVTIAVAAQVLGHSPKILASRYGHLEIGALRAAQEQRWGAAA